MTAYHTLTNLCCFEKFANILLDLIYVNYIVQVIVLRYFSKLAGSRSLMTRKMLNVLLLLQYVPRLLRVYLSAKELGRSYDSLTRRVWVRGAFFFFLYVIFGHVSLLFFFMLCPFSFRLRFVKHPQFFFIY